MRVLVTGATGFIGRAICRRLIADGHTLVIASRDPKRASAGFPHPATFAKWQMPLAADGLHGVDAIIHLAGESVAQGRWNEEKKRRILDSRLEGARILEEYLKRTGTRPVLVSASAIGYYGDRADEELTESSPAGTGFLSEVCRQWESAVAGVGASRTVIFRLGIVLGKDGGALPRMLTPFRMGVGGVLGGGRPWMSWIHIDDVAGLMATALKEGRYEGVINATAPTPVTNAEFTKALGRAVGRPALLPTPSLALRLLFGEMAGEILASLRVLPAKALALGYAFRFSQIGPALDDLTHQ